MDNQHINNQHIDNQYYINNWNKLWKTYAALNPDLANNGVTTKRALLNHYIKNGQKENRQVEYKAIKESVNLNTKNIIYEDKKQIDFLLNENMFKEKCI